MPAGGVSVAGCPLCDADGGKLLWRDDRCRIVLAGEPDYPAFCRVIWSGHVREFSDLAEADRQYLIGVVVTVEQTLRDLLEPDKINLASLGNQVPHLHWHVIPRFRDDAHFPDPVWAPRRRDGAAYRVDDSRLAGELSSRLTGSIRR